MQSKIILQDFGSEVIQWATNELPNALTIISTLILLVVSYVVYKLAFTPINRIKDLTDIGYEQFQSTAAERKKNFKMYVNEIRRLKEIGQLPPIVPNGWYALLESEDLAPGDAKSVTALGKTFAVFRSLKGESYVLDGYCPHLGANLGLGGQVKGSCIECPFHGWQFDGKSGECKRVPYSDKVPAHTRVKKWSSVEKHGWVFVWFHAEGEEPWFLPDMNEIVSGEYVYRGRAEHIINTHVQDISENGADTSHLEQVHSPNLMAGTDLKHTRVGLWSFGKHEWNLNWQEQEAPNAHTAILTLSHTMKLFGKFPLLTAHVRGIQVGPSMVYLRMSVSHMNSIFLQTATPITPTEIRMVHRFYCSRYVPTPYCNVFVVGEAIMFERDIMVWNHKRYNDKPLFVKEDRQLARHRRWFAQFYSENSPRYSTFKESLSW